jgi:signal transduction histidine kinase/ligand-binding sensor domain-containing protein
MLSRVQYSAWGESVVRRAAIVLGVLLAACHCSFALNPALDVSQYAHTSWKISEGVTTGTTHTIVQTKDGYLWLATESGLRRFDGVHSVAWQPPAGEHLPSIDIRELLAARDGTLWLGTAKGFASWKDGKLTHYPQFDGYDVNTIREDHEGTVWAAGVIWEHAFNEPGRLCAIKAGNVQCYGRDGAFGFGVTAIHEDSRGNLWLGAANGLWRWKPGPPRHYALPAALFGAVFSRNSLIEGDNGALIITGVHDILQFVNGSVTPYPFPSAPPPFKNTTMLRDREGSLWISATDVGLVHVHQGRMDFFTDRDGLSSNSIEGLFEDREGSIWVATNLGIDRFREYPIPTIGIDQGLSSRMVVCVLAARDGSVWLGTSDGLNRWKDGQVTIYRRPTRRTRQKPEQAGDGPAPSRASHSRWSTAVREVTSSGLPDNFITSLFQDPEGRIWISTFGGLAYLENGKFSRAAGMPLTPQNPLVKDTAGNLWTAQPNEGLVRMNGGKLIEQIPWDRLGIKGALANPLAADPADGGIWVGSWSGGVIHFLDGQVRAFYGTREGLGGGRVNSLQFDSGGRLWAATDGGLTRISKGRAITLTSNNGLPCDIAQDVLEDDTHALWVHMACGLVRIAKGELDAWAANPGRRIQNTVYDASDGVISHAGVYNFGPRAAKTADGKLWFPPVEGVMVVDPHHLPSNTVPAPVHIEEVKGDDKTVWQNLTRAEASNLRLPARTRSLEIGYTGLSFVAPEKVRFKYKLDGYDREWQDAGNRRQAFFTNLPPRNYRFRVIASNNSGVWNETGAMLEFSIAPAYYQTSWFRASVVIALLLAFWGLYRSRLHQIGREFNANLEGRVDERLRVARDLHDTLLQSFQGLMPVFQTARNLLPGQSDRAAEVLDEGLHDAADAIVEGRNAIQNLRAKPSLDPDLGSLLDAAGQELAQSPEAEGSAPAFRVVVEGPRQPLAPLLQDEIYRIGREMLRNAFRHAHAARIEAEIRYDSGMFRLRIRDDGKGIDSSVLKEGARTGHWGLPGMHERAKRMGGRLKIWSEPGAGTEAELTVPARIAYEKFSTSNGWWARLGRRLRLTARNREA